VICCQWQVKVCAWADGRHLSGTVDTRHLSWFLSFRTRCTRMETSLYTPYVTTESTQSNCTRHCQLQVYSTHITYNTRNEYGPQWCIPAERSCSSCCLINMNSEAINTTNAPFQQLSVGLAVIICDVSLQLEGRRSRWSSGYRARHWTTGSRVRTQQKTVD
jgi:hypothetical protein